MTFPFLVFALFFATSTGEPIIDWLTQAGPVGILAFGVIAFFKGWIVSGSAARSELADMKAQRDKALELVYKNAELANRILEVSERK